MNRRDEHIDHFLRKRKEGIDYSEIHRQLMQLGYSKSDATKIINELDGMYVSSRTKRFSLHSVVDWARVHIGKISLVTGLAMLVWAGLGYLRGDGSVYLESALGFVFLGTSMLFRVKEQKLDDIREKRDRKSIMGGWFR